MSSGVSADEIVVGEAVALEVAQSGFGRRMLGAIIDAISQITFLALVLYLATRFLAELPDTALVRVAFLVIVVGVFVGWPAAWETATRGRSLGKFALGERVVRVDGGSITYRHAMIRALIGFVEIWWTGFGLAAFAILISRRSQRLGDMAAGTMVVREKVQLKLPPPAGMPPYLQSWAAQADITSLGPTLALNVRQYLQRRAQMSPLARHGLAQRLCDQVAQHVSPPPPPCQPDDFLMAVLAERARRDRRRLAHARSLSARLLGRVDAVPLGAVGRVPAQSPANAAYRHGAQQSSPGASGWPPQS